MILKERRSNHIFLITKNTLKNYLKKDYLIKALNELNFKELTKVQLEVYETLKQNRNILVRSKTGSGKTHAFLIPIFNDLDENLKEVQAVIIAPTNELAFQLYNVCRQIGDKADNPIDIRLYNSNCDSNLEAERLSKKQPQIVIGTPGKVHELVVNKNALKIHKTKYYVLDEADMSFESGFADTLDNLSAIMKDSRMIFLSATIHEKIESFIKKYLQNPVYIDLNDTFENKIEHIWIPIKYKERIDVLSDLVNTINPYLCIIFVNKKENIPFVYKTLANLNKDVCALHGDLDIRERKRVLKEINKLKYQYVVASDIVARGIDIEGVDTVIQYELPYDYEFYVHRSGRCGRMNRSGKCYALYDTLDDNYLDLLNKKGVVPTYFEIRDKELIPYKGRNLRKERQIPKTDYVKIAERHIPKSKKVKPGYKKKRQQEVLALAKKLKNKENKRGFRK